MGKDSEARTAALVPDVLQVETTLVEPCLDNYRLAQQRFYNFCSTLLEKHSEETLGDILDQHRKEFAYLLNAMGASLLVLMQWVALQDASQVGRAVYLFLFVEAVWLKLARRQLKIPQPIGFSETLLSELLPDVRDILRSELGKKFHIVFSENYADFLPRAPGEYKREFFLLLKKRQEVLYEEAIFLLDVNKAYLFWFSLRHRGSLRRIKLAVVSRFHVDHLTDSSRGIFDSIEAWLSCQRDTANTFLREAVACLSGEPARGEQHSAVDVGDSQLALLVDSATYFYNLIVAHQAGSSTLSPEEYRAVRTVFLQKRDAVFWASRGGRTFLYLADELKADSQLDFSSLSKLSEQLHILADKKPDVDDEIIRDKIRFLGFKVEKLLELSSQLSALQEIADNITDIATWVVDFEVSIVHLQSSLQALLSVAGFCLRVNEDVSDLYRHAHSVIKLTLDQPHLQGEQIDTQLSARRDLAVAVLKKVRGQLDDCVSGKERASLLCQWLSQFNAVVEDLAGAMQRCKQNLNLPGFEIGPATIYRAEAQAHAQDVALGVLPCHEEKSLLTHALQSVRKAQLSRAASAIWERGASGSRGDVAGAASEGRPRLFSSS